jgi:hypothetical protein
MPDMTVEQFTALCNLAREFNQYVSPERTRHAAPAKSDATGTRPGDDYNRRGSWAELLEPHGWKVDRTSGSTTYWTRPGKDDGVSATTGKCTSEVGGDLLYVFSTNADPFEGDSAYSKFSAYTVLEHKGDFTAATKALVSAGYGDHRDDPRAVFGNPPPLSEQADDGISPDFDFATNPDLKRLNLTTAWVWPKWLQFGVVNLLAAEGGMGKTRWVADLCRRVHAKEAWPDGGEGIDWPGQYIAMWVAGDRNFAELVELSEKFGFGDRICYSGSKADPTSGITLNDSREFVALYRKVKAARPLFLFIDTAGGATDANLAKQEEARRFFAPLSDIAIKLGVCVVVITHLNASKNVLGKRAEERVRCVIRITAENREPETTRRIEVIKSNNLFPAPLGMTLHETGSTYTDEAPPAPEGGYSVPTKSDDGNLDKGPPTKVRACMEWLEDELDEQPKRVSVLIESGKENEFSIGIVYKAKTALGIIETIDSQGYKWWGLKERSNTD